MQKHKISEAHLFLQQIVKDVVKSVLFDYTSSYFTPMARVYSFIALLSTASVCLIPVIKCEIHFQLSIALNGTCFPINIIV